MTRGNDHTCSSAPPNIRDPHHELPALWDLLESLGAVVKRIDTGQLPADVLYVLADNEARRVRALYEGIAAGAWPPVRRQETCRQAEAVDTENVTMPSAAADDTERVELDGPAEAPIQVRFHQPRWRAIA